MQLIDPTAVIVLLTVVGLAALTALALIALSVPRTLLVTRRDRVARHETIPTYYGRLHFAG